MSVPPARSRAERTRDTLHRLEHDVDAWIATTDPERGTPHMVPLSFHWDGEAVIVATTDNSVTGRNLERSGLARIGLGTTRDVVLIEGRVERSYPAAEIDPALGMRSRPARASTPADRRGHSGISTFARGVSRPGARRTSWRAAC